MGTDFIRGFNLLVTIFSFLHICFRSFSTDLNVVKSYKECKMCGNEVLRANAHIKCFQKYYPPVFFP